MNTTTSTIVQGLSALITQLGRRQMRTQLVNVGGEMCLAVPATFIERRAAHEERGNPVARRATAARDAVVSANIEQRQYLSTWQTEMEDFDRF